MRGSRLQGHTGDADGTRHEGGGEVSRRIRSGFRSFSLVSIGQGMTRLNPYIAASTAGGSIYSNHAAIAIGTSLTYDQKRTNVNQIAHATGSNGIHRSSLGAVSAMRVFRMRSSAMLANAAHEVALKWTQSVRNGGYSIKKALAPGFHSSSYGSGAKERARFYHSHRNTIGGPPGVKHDKKEMFCSMFVVACYQAALGENMSAAYMALDAPYTSPMKLQDYLSSCGTWEQIA